MPSTVHLTLALVFYKTVGKKKLAQDCQDKWTADHYCIRLHSIAVTALWTMPHILLWVPQYTEKAFWILMDSKNNSVTSPPQSTKFSKKAQTQRAKTHSNTGRAWDQTRIWEWSGTGSLWVRYSLHKEEVVLCTSPEERCRAKTLNNTWKEPTHIHTDLT